MKAYATPVLLGGPEFMMTGPLVYVQFAARANRPFGAAVSVILMTATLGTGCGSWRCLPCAPPCVGGRIPSLWAAGTAVKLVDKTYT